LQLAGFGEFLLGLGFLALAIEGDGEGYSAGQGWSVQLQSGVEVFDGVGKLVLLDERIGEVGESLDGPGIDREGLAVLFDGFGGFSLCGEQAAKARMGGGEIWIELQRPPIMRDGCECVAVGGERVAEAEMCWSIVRVELDGFGKVGNSLIEVSLGGKHASEIEHADEVSRDEQRRPAPTLPVVPQEQQNRDGRRQRNVRQRVVSADSPPRIHEHQRMRPQELAQIKPQSARADEAAFEPGNSFPFPPGGAEGMAFDPQGDETHCGAGGEEWDEQNQVTSGKAAAFPPQQEQCDHGQGDRGGFAPERAEIQGESQPIEFP
jgi:hypothetical protein